MRSVVLILLALIVSVSPTFGAQATTTLPDCFYRSTFLKEPWIKVGIACMEEVIDQPDAGELGFTALAAAPDGTLYAARPLAGEVLALTDTNDDLLPETPRVVAEGLTQPNGLAYHDGALYISGGAHIYRLRGEQLDTLVDDVPSGGGFWTGGIAIYDGRLYVATGAPCDFCAPDDPARGAILSYTLDGTDRQIVATGLRQPSDLVFQGSDLYVVDSARTGLFAVPDLDELNRVEAGDNFGFPYCVGANTPDMPGSDCASATPPLIPLPTASTPLGIAAYDGDLIPSLKGKLLLVLGGSNSDLELRGYWIAIADPVARTVESLMPTRPDDTADSDFSLEAMSYRGSGFFPHRPLDVTVTEQGWVYISIGGGRIIVLR